MKSKDEMSCGRLETQQESREGGTSTANAGMESE